MFKKIKSWKKVVDWKAVVVLYLLDVCHFRLQIIRFIDSNSMEPMKPMNFHDVRLNSNFPGTDYN